MESDGFGWLVEYKTGSIIRPATAEEERASIDAAERDGGYGVIIVGGIACFVA